MSEKRRVPEELDDIMSEAIALDYLRDKFVQLPFCYRRAVKSAVAAEQKRRKFWRSVIALYPEAGIGNWSYDRNSLMLTSQEATP